MRYFKKNQPKNLSRRMTVVLAAALGLTVCMLCAIPRSSMAATTQRDLPIYCVQKDSKVCSLTFDAAWGNEDTQQLIDILGKYQIKATFFVVGEWVDKFPESVKALHDAGHEIMNHSDDHAHFTKLSADQIRAQLDSCNKKIEAITGVCPTLFRPPYGEYDDKVVSTTRECDMYTIQWDVEPLETAENHCGTRV